MRTPDELMQEATARGIVIDVARGELHLRVPEGVEVDDLVPDLRQHKSEITARLRPNLLDLATRHRRLFGAPLTENYKHITGVDLRTTNPDWEDLRKYDAWLRDEEAELLPLLEEFEEREASGA